MTWFQDDKGRWINLKQVYRIMDWEVADGYCIKFQFIGADNHFSDTYKTEKECKNQIKLLIEGLND